MGLTPWTNGWVSEAWLTKFSLHGCVQTHPSRSAISSHCAMDLLEMLYTMSFVTMIGMDIIA